MLANLQLSSVSRALLAPLEMNMAGQDIEQPVTTGLSGTATQVYICKPACHPTLRQGFAILAGFFFVSDTHATSPA